MDRSAVYQQSDSGLCRWCYLPDQPVAPEDLDSEYYFENRYGTWGSWEFTGIFRILKWWGNR